MSQALAFSTETPLGYAIVMYNSSNLGKSNGNNCISGSGEANIKLLVDNKRTSNTGSNILTILDLCKSLYSFLLIFSNR
jgi:hypothetical protein